MAGQTYSGGVSPLERGRSFQERKKLTAALSFTHESGGTFGNGGAAHSGGGISLECGGTSSSSVNRSGCFFISSRASAFGEA